MMPTKIQWNSAGKVVQFERAIPSWEGPLADAIRRVMAMTPEDRLQAKIAIDEDVVPGTTLLGHREIEAIFRRPDFPQK